MGNYSKRIKNEREQLYNSKLFVLPFIEHYPISTSKPPKKRMESKLIVWLITMFNAGYGLLIFLNIENIKGFILFVIAALYGCARLFFYVVKQNQERRMREIDIQERQKELAKS